MGSLGPVQGLIWINILDSTGIHVQIDRETYFSKNLPHSQTVINRLWHGIWQCSVAVSVTSHGPLVAAAPFVQHVVLKESRIILQVHGVRLDQAETVFHPGPTWRASEYDHCQSWSWEIDGKSLYGWPKISISCTFMYNWCYLTWQLIVLKLRTVSRLWGCHGSVYVNLPYRSSLWKWASFEAYMASSRAASAPTESWVTNGNEVYLSHRWFYIITMRCNPINQLPKGILRKTNIICTAESAKLHLLVLVGGGIRVGGILTGAC